MSYNETVVASSEISWALHYANRGWTVFPLDGETKVSYTWRGQHNQERWGATKDPAIISNRFAAFPNAGIGIPTGCENGFWVIETDTKNGKDGESELAKLQPLPTTYRVRSPSGSIHYYFLHPGPDVFITCSANKIAPGVDVKGDAGMVVAPPTARGGKRYEIIDNVPIAAAPQWLLDLVTRKVTDEEKRIVRHAPPTDEPTVTQWEITKLERWVREALEKNPDWFDVRENALKTVWGIKRAGYGCEGYRIAQIICERVPETQRVARVDRFWNDRDANNGTASLDTFWRMCADIGIRNSPDETTEWRRQEGDRTIQRMAAAVGVPVVASPSIVSSIPPCPIPMPESRPIPRGGGSLMGPRGEVLPMLADDSLALDFADMHVSELRHCEELGKWLRWGGARWQTDKTSFAYNLVRQHLRKMGGGLHPQDASKILSAKTVAAVERMAKTDPRIATEAAIWDADPWLLNTPGGVVDLRTCVIRECRPDDHMTKSTAVAAGGECPTWEAFLHRALNGDAELISFVQRMLGYALTGDTREQVLFFLYGQGGNGKGVLLNTVAGILADYAKTAPMATFTDSANAGDRHPTDLAGLRGARFVMASETEKGRKWAEAKIKSLTGGDPISARFMGRDFFEYVPTFKLVIAGNHKPRLSTVDEAIRRRMNMVPFTVNIPAAERDPTLPEKLKKEWPGILQWMVKGCLAWQRDGLQAPKAVTDATADYLNSQDAMATWLDERCEQAAGAWATRTELFSSWSAWAHNAREPIGNANEFYEAMASKGFEAGKSVGARGFRGVKLRMFDPNVTGAAAAE